MAHQPRRTYLEFDNNQYGRKLYERTVSSFDKKLGELLHVLETDDTVILTGDHGERLVKGNLEEYSDRSKNIYNWIKKKFGNPNWMRNLPALRYNEKFVITKLLLFF